MHAHSPSSNPFKPGDVVLGKYRISAYIGGGGMGHVYQAQHIQLGRRVAIKALSAPLIGKPKYIARFEREARAAGVIEHENVVTLFDVISDQIEGPLIVMEFVDGVSLRALIRQHAPLPPGRCSSIAIQIAAGTAAAHKAGVVHRDLKPENVMLTQRADGSDWVKVVDFGVARLTDAKDAVSLTRTGAALGTAQYMAPEQARGEEVDERGDVYALGAITYELLSGHKAHPGDSYNKVLYHVLSTPVTPLLELNPALPKGICAVIHRALEKRREDRHASMTELRDEIARHSDWFDSSVLTRPDVVTEPTGKLVSKQRAKLLASGFAVGFTSALPFLFLVGRDASVTEVAPEEVPSETVTSSPGYGAFSESAATSIESSAEDSPSASGFAHVTQAPSATPSVLASTTPPEQGSAPALRPKEKSRRQPLRVIKKPAGNASVTTSDVVAVPVSSGKPSDRASRLPAEAREGFLANPY